jgi:hypothetical protein
MPHSLFASLEKKYKDQKEKKVYHYGILFVVLC